MAYDNHNNSLQTNLWESSPSFINPIHRYILLHSNVGIGETPDLAILVQRDNPYQIVFL